MSKKRKTLLIIDGYGFIFRAYHVQPTLTAQNGMPVGAIYGFTSMLIKLLNDFKPEHVVIALDCGGKNFRHNIYSQYKANRPPATEDLIYQLSLVKKAATALNFPVLEKQGFEADDIIATLARHATNLKEDAIIISSDKDLMQLINGYIKMYDPVKAKYITVDDVMAKFGVDPSKVREVQALIGDKSDNIPGVAGIGPKTAAQLIKEYGDIKGIFNSLDKLTNIRQKELLSQNYENALISWQLVGLNEDVDIDLNISNLRWKAPNKSIISDFLHEYGFRSLVKRVENLFNLKIDDIVSHRQEPLLLVNTFKSIFIETNEQFQTILKIIEQEGQVGINFISQDNNIQVNLSTGYEIYRVNYLKENEFLDDLFSHSQRKKLLPNLNKQIHNLFADISIKKITCNLKQILKTFNCKIRAFDDLQLMYYCLSAGKKSKTFEEIIKTYVNADLNEMNFNEAVRYFNTCYKNLISELVIDKILHLYQDIDLPLCYILNDMEKHGIKININYLKKLSDTFSQEIKKLKEQIFILTGEEFNISSTKQLGQILFDKLKLPFSKISSKSKSYSTSSDVLEKLNEEGYEIADLIIKYRHLTKLKNTYTDTLPKQADTLTDRIHTTFLQTSTTTGRLSSHDPNVQNIPIRTDEGNKIRAAFIAQKGNKLISADYSQIELRILSHVANIPALKTGFNNKLDIHTQTASQIFRLKPEEINPDIRRSAKAINFGIIYGISAFGLAKQLSITKKEAANYIDKYFQEYPGIKDYMISTIDFAKKHGYVKNLLGRKCFIPDINNKNHTLSSFAERAAINAPMQSLAADIVKLAMINIYYELKARKMQTQMILQIHDELIFESPEEEVQTAISLIKSIMENTYKLDIPTNVDIGVGDNWQKIH